SPSMPRRPRRSRSGWSRTASSSGSWTGPTSSRPSVARRSPTSRPPPSWSPRPDPVTAAALALRDRAGVSLSTSAKLLLLAVAVAVVYIPLRGQWTLPHSDDAGLFTTLNGVRDWVDANRTINPVFLYFFGPVRTGIDLLNGALTFVFDDLSWVGFFSIVTALALALVTWRTALLVAISLTV